MAVLTGEATIRFGVGDTTDDLQDSTWGSGKEQGGIEMRVRAGDVFVIPAGVAHKTYDTTPAAEFRLLTPGSGKGVESDDPKAALAGIELTGFTMLGAYPEGSEWDFDVGGLDHRDWDRVWRVERPKNDPVLGQDMRGLCGLWKPVDRGRL
jgi:uncharacterized protein YjlB